MKVSNSLRRVALAGLLASVHSQSAQASVVLTDSSHGSLSSGIKVKGVDCTYGWQERWHDSKNRSCKPPSAEVYTASEVEALIADAEKRIVGRFTVASRALEKSRQKDHTALVLRLRGEEDRTSRLEQSVLESLDRFEQRVMNDRFVQLLREQLRAEFAISKR